MKKLSDLRKFVTDGQEVTAHYTELGENWILSNDYLVTIFFMEGLDQCEYKIVTERKPIIDEMNEKVEKIYVSFKTKYLNGREGVVEVASQLSIGDTIEIFDSQSISTDEMVSFKIIDGKLFSFSNIRDEVLGGILLSKPNGGDGDRLFFDYSYLNNISTKQFFEALRDKETFHMDKAFRFNDPKDSLYSLLGKRGTDMDHYFNILKDKIGKDVIANSNFFGFIWKIKTL